MNYPQLLVFALLILFALCFNRALSAGETFDPQEEQESKEFENYLLENVRSNYRNGYVEMMNFVNSMDNTFSALKSKIEDLKQEIKIIRKLNNLRANLTRGECDEIIQSSQTEIKIGNSFNGSTFSDIQSQASAVFEAGSYTVVVLVNHLDEIIQGFTIYDHYNSSYIPAPKSIPPRTQEIFTFAKPSDCDVWTSFSYAIPNGNLRVAAISNLGAYGAGLAFVRNDTDMKTYWRTKKGIEGSFVYECCGGDDKNLSVGYKKFQARMSAVYKGQSKAVLRIELIKLSMQD